jgi:DNA-binding transcriptional ArsR family regulator
MPVTQKPIDPDGVAGARQAVSRRALLAVVVETLDALADSHPEPAALRKRSLCVRDLAAVTGVSESVVSHQLRFFE